MDNLEGAELQQHVAKLERELQWARLKIQALQQELRLERIKKYGPQSETLSSLQLELLDCEPGVSGEGGSEAGREPLSGKPPRERMPHPGQQCCPSTCPVSEKTSAVPIAPVSVAAPRPPP